MKKFILLLLSIICISCVRGLDKKYQKATKVEDLSEVAEQITSLQLIQLKSYVSELESNGAGLTDKTYRKLLFEIEEIEYKKALKIEEELTEEAKRVEEESLKARITLNSDMLCSKKWIISAFGLQLKIPNNSNENIELAKTILNKTNYFKGVTMSFVLGEHKNRSFVRGVFDQKFTSLMSGNRKKTKEYFEDGTFVEKLGDEEYTGTWEFISENEFEETRFFPEERLNKKEYFTIEILNLSENLFSFYEMERDPYAEVDTIRTYFEMDTAEK